MGGVNLIQDGTLAENKSVPFLLLSPVPFLLSPSPFSAFLRRIKVEKVLPAIACPQVSYCVDGANGCPPEDVGGEPGYAEFLEAMADPGHPEHEAMMEWYGGNL